MKVAANLLLLAAVGGVLPAATAQRFFQRGLRRTLRSDPIVHDEDADAVVASRQLEEDLVAIDLADDNAASLSMSMGAATEFFMAAKAGKADGGPAKPPATPTPAPAPSKAAKADDDGKAKSEKSGKSDLSFSMSLSSKSGKSKSSKTQAPTPCVNPEVPSAKSSKSKSAKSVLSYSFSYGPDGSSKSGKSDGLSFSMSLPSKSSKGEGAAKSAKGAGTKASKSTIPCLTDAPTKNPTESPTKNPTESPTKNPTESPTKNPTESPTKNPTESPTGNPCGDCLTSNGSPGCTNAACEATVCANDGFCCGVTWDLLCVAQANDLCSCANGTPAITPEPEAIAREIGSTLI